MHLHASHLKSKLTEDYRPTRANTTAAYSTRKTIAPEAVIDALDEIEFPDFVPRVQAELKRFNEVQTGKRNEYRRKLKEKEADKGDRAGAPEGGEERAAKRVRRDGAVTIAAKGSIGTGGAAKGILRGKEDEMDQEADDQPEDVELIAAEEFDAEPEVEPEAGQGDEDVTEAEAEAGGEDDDNEDDEDEEEDSSGVEQDDVDVDDADLRERAARRGPRGDYGDDDDDDDDDATSSGSEEASGSESESTE